MTNYLQAANLIVGAETYASVVEYQCLVFFFSFLATKEVYCEHTISETCFNLHDP
uniref:Uncharacterized protein n=1 Tax=Arundo donax TaxID=35708 RepID=A0A0A9FWP9_ARUDO